MTRLLSLFGLMRVSEHERSVRALESQLVLRESAFETIEADRDRISDKFKRAATDLAAQAEDLRSFESALDFTFGGKCPICDGVEGCSHSRGERVRAAIAKTAASEDVFEALNNAHRWIEHWSAEAEALRPDAEAMRKKRAADRKRMAGKRNG